MASTKRIRDSGDHQVQVPPGWYPQPTNASEVRWWDGQCWGPTLLEARDAGWWLANDGHYYPPGPPSAGQGPGPTPFGSIVAGVAPAASSKAFYAHWWFWVLVAVGVPFAMLGVYVMGVLSQIGPEDYQVVYVEDFSTGAGKFEVWEEPEGSAAVVDGVYVMTNRSGGRNLTVGVESPWNAERVRIDAQMELVEAADLDGFGVYLRRTDGKDYVFSVYPAGFASIAGPGVDCKSESPMTNVRAGDITLSGGHDGDNVTTLTGSLDGEVIVTCVDEGFDPNDGAFQGAGLWLSNNGEFATVQVDNVTVTSFRY